jgi:hypothetical protein
MVFPHLFRGLDLVVDQKSVIAHSGGLGLFAHGLLVLRTHCFIVALDTKCMCSGHYSRSITFLSPRVEPILTVQAPQTQSKLRDRPRTFDREAALESALALFWRLGYEQATIAELC